MEVEKERLRELYIALAERLMSGDITGLHIQGDKAIFKIEVVKPHITYTETISLPIADWFLERYCLKK